MKIARTSRAGCSRDGRRNAAIFLPSGDHWIELRRVRVAFGPVERQRRSSDRGGRQRGPDVDVVVLNSALPMLPVAATSRTTDGGGPASAILRRARALTTLPAAASLTCPAPCPPARAPAVACTCSRSACSGSAAPEAHLPAVHRQRVRRHHRHRVLPPPPAGASANSIACMLSTNVNVVNGSVVAV